MKRALMAVLVVVATTVASQVLAQDPRLSLELDNTEAVVGQPLILRLTILVPSYMPKPPVFPSFEVPDLMVRLPERASTPTSQSIDGVTWAGIIQSYRLYPLRAGEFRIPAQVMTVTYADPESPPAPLEAEIGTEEIVFTALIPEAAAELDPLIVAQGLTLEQTIDAPEGGGLAPGDAVTRQVTVKIDGAPAMMVPGLISAINGTTLRAYPKEPTLSEQENRGELSGIRTEVVTYVAQEAGPVTLPPISLGWFNIDSGAVETAEVPGIDLKVVGSAAEDAPLDWRRLMVAAFAGVVVLGLLWLLRRRYGVRLGAAVQALRQRREATEGHAFGVAKTAIAGRDLSATLQAVAVWKARAGATDPALDAELEAALHGVMAGRYGRDQDRNDTAGWAAMARELRRQRGIRRKMRRPDQNAEDLPALNPWGDR